MWAGAIALAVGLSAAIPAAQALWHDPDTLPAVTFPRGAVGFAATRDYPGNLGDPADQRLKDSLSLTDPNAKAFSNLNAYATRRGSVDSASQGTTMLGQLTQADAQTLETPDATLYAKYVVDALAEANAALTYTARLNRPSSPDGGGITTGATVRFYLVPDSEYNPDTIGSYSCGAFFTRLDDGEFAATVGGVYTGTALSITNVPTLVAYGETTGKDLWCLEATPPDSSEYENTASITGQTKVGQKSNQDDWSATLVFSDDAADQLIVAFTPTVSRWDP
ncbi:MAG: hypothetical protein LBS27_09415 [Bifidobacteriaceae bacterium]|jgi:hypothetical protein|nr:hypothetical protein [Bifidobacteriaceae bacterium]